MASCDYGTQRMIRLKTADNHIFKVKEAVGLELHLLKDAIRNNPMENPIYPLPGITKDIMFMVIKYCKNHNDKFVKEVNSLTLFDLIQAAHYLKIESLMDLTCQILVNKVMTKTVPEIRKEFIDQKDDWSSGGKHFKRAYSCTDRILRQCGKETFIKKSNFVGVHRSSPVTNVLSFIERRAQTDLRLPDSLGPDVLECLLKIIKQYDSWQKVKCSALYTLSRVSFDACNNEMTNDAIQSLVEVMSNPFTPSASAAVKTLTHIAYYFPKYKKDILETNALEVIRNIVQMCRGDKPIGQVAKFLAAVCHGYDLPRHKVDVALTILGGILQMNFVTIYPIEQSCYALLYLSHEKKLQIEGEALKKLVERLIKFILCFSKYPSIKCPAVPGYALGVVGNIARWGSSDQIEILTSNCLLLKCLGTVMLCNSKKIRMEACQIISIIAAKRKTSIKDMYNANLIEALCNLLQKDESDVKMEATWAVFNGIYGLKYRRPPLARTRRGNDNRFGFVSI